MFEATSRPRPRWRVFWPEVNDLSGAREAIRLAVWFTLLAAGLSLVVAVGVLLSGAGAQAFARVVVFGAIGAGLLRRLRVAAVAGVVLLAIGIVGVIAQGRIPGVVEVLTFVAMLSGVRGTFAHARLSRAPLPATVFAPAPPLPTAAGDAPPAIPATEGPTPPSAA